MIEIPQLLLVSGSNRNVGKTTFICRVIENISKKKDIYGIKITPHFHNSRTNKNILIETSTVFISEELDNQSKKDSSLMLQNGAEKVYYIEIQDDNYKPIVDFIQTLPTNIPLVCESASLRKYIKPGLFILIDNDNVGERKPIFNELQQHADIIIQSNQEMFDINKIVFKNRWEIYSD
jgi:hypothetical protein